MGSHSIKLRSNASLDKAIARLHQGKQKRQIMFGAVDRADKDKHVPRWTLHGQANQVREAVGKVWCKENPSDGWRAAFIEGMRVVRVELKIIPPTDRRHCA